MCRKSQKSLYTAARGTKNKKKKGTSKHTDLSLLPVLHGALDAPTAASVILLGKICGLSVASPIATTEVSSTLRAVAPGAHAFESEIIDWMLIIISLDDERGTDPIRYFRLHAVFWMQGRNEKA